MGLPKTRPLCLILLFLCVFGASPSIRAEESAPTPLWVIAEKGRFGYIDRSGQVVIAPRFEKADPFSEGIAAVRYGGRWGFVDRKGRMIVPPRFEAAGPFSGGLARIKKGGKWAFVDTSGRIVTRARFTWAMDLKEGMALVEEKGKYGYVDAYGRVSVEPRFDEAGEFWEGLARVRLRKLWGFIDRTGKTVIEPRFDYADNFHEGLAQVEKNHRHGYINPAGDLIIPHSFHGHRMEGFSEGRALVVDGGKYGYIDASGAIVIPPKYWLAWGFHQGLARVQTDDAKWILIDRKGQPVSRNGFDHIDDFHEGFARVRVFRDYGFVGLDGNLSIPMKFAAALPFSEGLSAVYTGGSHRQLPVEDPMRRFDPMSPLFHYLTLPFSREKVPRMGGGQGWGYINGEGTFVIQPGFDFVGSFRGGLAEARRGRFHGYIDKEGKFVWKTVEKESLIP